MGNSLVLACELLHAKGPPASSRRPKSSAASSGQGETRRPNPVCDALRSAFLTHRGDCGLPGLSEALWQRAAAKLNEAAKRCRADGIDGGPESLENFWAAIQGETLQTRPNSAQRGRAHTLQLQIVAACPALATSPRRTLSGERSQGLIRVALSAGLPASSRGWGLSGGIRETKKNPSPCGQPFGMCCPSASCMLHAGSVACHTHLGQLPCQPSQHGEPANIETTGYTTSTAGSRHLLQPCSFCEEAHIIAGLQQRLGARHSQPRHRDKLRPCGLVSCRWAHAAPQ